MLRGIDKKDIFLNSRDYEKFIEIIRNAQDKSRFSIFAYCLMTNHVHILLKTNLEEIGDSIRRIAVSYAQYHNIKNGRTGHLFQNRFKSEAVNSENYFLTVVRYIHLNPLKAGLVKNLIDYKWSSYNEYISNEIILIEPKIILNYFKDMNSFIEYHHEENNDVCLDTSSRDEIIRKIKENTSASNRQLSRVLNLGRSKIDRIK